MLSKRAIKNISYSFLVLNGIIHFILAGIYGSPNKTILDQYGLEGIWKTLTGPWTAYFAVFGVFVIVLSVFGIFQLNFQFKQPHKSRVQLIMPHLDSLNLAFNFAIATLCCAYYESISLTLKAFTSTSFQIVTPVPIKNLMNIVIAEAVIGVLVIAFFMACNLWCSIDDYSNSSKVQNMSETQINH